MGNTIQTKPGQTERAPIVTRVASADTGTPLLDARADRIGLTIHNSSTSSLRISEGGVATLTFYSMLIAANTVYEAREPIYTGAITFIHSAVNGTVHAVERV